MKLRHILAAVLTAAVLLSGCSALSLNGSDILAPPKAAGSRAEIQKMIEQDSDGSFALIYPSSGEHKSGVIFYDMNKDGAEEATALYTTSSGAAKVLFASRDGDSYRMLGSSELSSSNVNSLCFADVNADGTDELIVGCDAGAPLASLNAYFADSEITKIKIAEGYSDYIAGDFDGNTAADVLLLMPPSVEATATAELMVFGEGSFTGKSSVEIDPEVMTYDSMRFGRIGENEMGAVIDGVVDSGAITTQVISYDSALHTLTNPLLIFSGYSETERDCKIYSQDINADEIIEFPLCTLTEHGKDEDVSQVCSVARWCTYDAGQMQLVEKQTTLLCEKMNFMLTADPELARKVTARCADESVMKIYSLTHKGLEPVIGTEQLTIKRYKKSDYDSSTIPEAKLFEDNTGVYTYILADKSVFTDDDVKNGFMLINKK